MRKQPNGRGSVLKVKSGPQKGRWHASITAGWDTETGKQVRPHAYFPTQREALAWRDKMIADRDAGKLPLTAQPVQTVAEFLTTWLEDVVRATRRPTTYEGYYYTIKRHVLPTVGDIALDALTPQDVQRLKNGIEAQGKTRTAEFAVILLRIALKLAMKWQLVDRNVASLVELPRRWRKEKVTLTQEEGARLLAAVAHDRYCALYTLDLTLGLRRGELLALRWQDIDLEARTITIRASLQRAAGSLHMMNPKTEAGHRTLNLPRLAVVALKAHRAQQREDIMRQRDKWQDLGYVFPNSIGKPLEPRRLNAMFTDIITQAGLPKISLHGLRHTVATILLQEGVELKVISELLGHADPSITRDIYIHVTPQMKQTPADKMDELFGGTGAESA